MKTKKNKAAEKEFKNLTKRGSTGPSENIILWEKLDN